jgi:uncharacterized membrane protein YdjX (TVP38/TMEM64 family)
LALPTLASAKRRALLLLVLAGAIAAVANSDALHGFVFDLFSEAEGIMRSRPILGPILFILFAAASAMLAFFSSAAIVPVAILVWGQAVSVFLLWLGWTLGGVLSFAVSHLLGRRVVYALAPRALLERYEQLVTHRPPFGLVLLLQLALPSEVPGYLLGLVRYPFWRYLAALVLAELPYAVATVYLGATFLERRAVPFLLLAGLLAAGSVWAFTILHRRFPASPPGADAGR